MNNSLPKVEEIKSITEETSLITCLCVVSKRKLASCSKEKFINIYSLETFNFEFKLVGHSKEVTSISKIKNGNLISSSEDKTIKIWYIGELYFKIVYSFPEQIEGVLKVISLRNDRICSCSWSSSIRIWRSQPPYDYISTLNGHLWSVLSILELKEKNYIASWGSDSKIIFWNTLTYKNEYSIDDVLCDSISSLYELVNNKLIIGGYNIITIISLNTFQVELKIEDQTLGGVLCFLQVNKMILCGSSKGSLLFLNYQTFELIERKEKFHLNSISSLVKFNYNIFISSSFDETIKVWKINSSTL